MSSTENIAIKFEKVNFSDEGLHILKNITGSFPEGKITTLVGPSGAGKSTLFKLCNGLKSPDSGDIYVLNQHIKNYNPIELRRTVGIALQSATMIKGNVYDNLNLPLDLQNQELSEDRGKELLKLVGLPEDYLYRNTKDLSGGQRQKLSIARTLVNQPEILLLDEITSSLDRVSQEDIEKLIKRINETYRTTIIWITHNLKQALDVGQYTWVMMEGQVIETGPSDILNHPQNEDVQRFVKGEAE
ncbi:putative ABC transport system ATP-binding protein [Salinibacillus kushneri]|uniref:Putative ABC transport system ATP-binding protein n=1 Tax=Salinibacillus kushneri TaxID=237682 RepID=A0A1I0JHT3_9BACI|nr:phosphate ABC transporter ATP-binding protein [Salinibacillus kushneri]SEU09830.1 putative ABC transport system ATP-binding protein [Salinibacillus kushneri]